MTKYFSIPKLDSKKWESLQLSLNSISKLISKLYVQETDENKRKDFEKISIELGLIDVQLGRHYTLEELMKEFKFKR